MYATTYAPASQAIIPASDWIANLYAPVARAVGRRSATAVDDRMAAARARQLRDLLFAAGPLTIADIAGGLAVTVHEASLAVAALRSRDCLCQDVDEWGRYRLASTCQEL